VKTETILVRVRPEEKQAFQEAADIAGIPMSAWVRERLRWASVRELEDAGKVAAFLVRNGD
jgi:uncharacterized protein (DUF1778 family)